MSAQPTELQARLIDLFGNPATADPTKLYGNLTVLPSGLIQVGTGIVMPDGYTSANTPMGRNKVINGNMKLAQRAALAYTNGASSYSGPDRYLAANAAGGGQFTQSQGTITYGGVTKSALVQTVNTIWSTFTGSNYWTGILQRIEGYNCVDMLGQPAALSFIFSTNVTGTFNVALQDSNQTNSYATTFSATAGVPTKVTILIPVLPTSMVVPNSSATGMNLWIGFLNAGTYQTANQNVWQSGNFVASASATNWAAVANNFIAVTEIQLETGTYATPFERRIWSQQLNDCYRYYASLVYSGASFNGIATSTSSAYSFGNTPPVVMRATPTASLTGTWTTTAPAGNTGSVTVTAVTANNWYLSNTTGTFTTGQTCYFGSSAGSTVNLAAEL